MADRADWKAVRNIQAVAQATARVAVVAAIEASVAAAGQVVTAAIEAVPVRDDPRGPAVISDAGALYRFLSLVKAKGSAELKQAIEGDADLIAWFNFMTPNLGDGGGGDIGPA